MNFKMQTKIKLLILLIILFSIGSKIFALDTIQEFYTPTTDNWSGSYGTYGSGQVFLATSTHSITSWTFNGKKGDAGGSCNYAFYATSGGLPIGSALSSGTFDTSSWPTSDADNNFNVESFNVTSGLSYAITIWGCAGDSGTYTKFNYDYTDSTYSDGTVISCSSGCSSPGNYTSAQGDFYFISYGLTVEPGGENTPITDTATSTQDQVQENITWIVIAFFGGMLFIIKMFV